MEVKDGDPSDTAKANLGIYGVGKRRTLAQLNDFVGVNLAAGTGNAQVNINCCGTLRSLHHSITHPRICFFAEREVRKFEVCSL